MLYSHFKIILLFFFLILGSSSIWAESGPRIYIFGSSDNEARYQKVAQRIYNEINKILKKQNMAIQLSFMPSSRITEELKKETLDGDAGRSGPYKEENDLDDYLYLKQPLCKTSFHRVFKAGQKKFESVAIMRGVVVEHLLSKDLEAVLVNSKRTAFEMVRKQRVDFTFLFKMNDHLVGDVDLKGLVLEEKPVRISKAYPLVHKKHRALKKAMEEALDQLNKKGVITSIVKRSLK